jgi:hypothetical protein
MRIILGIALTCAFIACNKGDKSSHSEDQPQEVLYQVSGPETLMTGNNGDLVLFGLSEVASRPDNKLIGGDAADPKDWPASFTTKHGNSKCTGTMIGPKALQLAAHCVGNGRTATITANGKTYTSTCTHSPKYKNDATADYALCLMAEAVDLPWYESVLTASTAKMKVGDKLILGGMGGTQPGSGNGGNDGIFRVGEAPIIRMPTGNNDIVTQGSSALAFGDSGGSAFWKDEKGILRIAGINSRGDIRKTSYLSAVFAKDGNDFYSSWVVTNNAVICGISDAATKCRGEDTPLPPESPVPAWCKSVFDHVGLCIFGNPRDSLANKDACRDDYAKLFACQEASELE